MKISACLIVKNEAENIRRCLDSINGVSVEIILVDTGSEDNTVEIALNYEQKYTITNGIIISVTQGIFL